MGENYWKNVDKPTANSQSVMSKEIKLVGELTTCSPWVDQSATWL